MTGRVVSMSAGLVASVPVPPTDATDGGHAMTFDQRERMRCIGVIALGIGLLLAVIYAGQSL